MTVLLKPTILSAKEFFNPALLSSDPEMVADLSRFESGKQAAGVYRVDLYLNSSLVATRDVQFVMREHSENQAENPVESSDDSGLAACFSRDALRKLGIRLTKSDETESEEAACLHLENLVPLATSTYDFANQRLLLSVPQAYLDNTVRGYIPPDEWDEGISALLMSYHLTGNTTRQRAGGEARDVFLNLNSGINVGPWRFRNYSTWRSLQRKSGPQQQRWENIYSYVQRTVVPMRAKLTLGDGYTQGEMFNSVGYRGVQLASDDAMLPDSLRGYAPIIRGVANSNATVTLRQNGYVIYQNTVPPGAFVIEDLFPTSSSGDLQVTVTEANGSENVYTVPYSTLPVLQREGRMKYSLTTGEYRSNMDFQEKPTFAEGNLLWGAGAGLTLYGGMQLSNNYKAAVVGSGMNWGDWGALSLDVTHARSTLVDNKQYQGNSIRLLYAKSLNEMGTNLQILGYRYSTRGFYTFDETSYQRMQGRRWQDYTEESLPEGPSYFDLNRVKKDNIQLNISQQFEGVGTLFASGNRQRYWNSERSNNLWQLGFSSVWNEISYSLTWNYNQNEVYNRPDQRIALSVSLPLGKWLSRGPNGRELNSPFNTAYGTYSVNTGNDGRTSHQMGVSGTLLEDNNLSYSVQQGYGNKGSGNTGNASLSYRGVYGNSNVGYSYSKDYQQVNYGVSGGVIAHANGVTFSQPLGDTNVLIKAPGASNVKVENATGIRTDWRGYAVVPYATNYRINRVALDATSLNDKVELENPVVNVIPTQGALVRADYITQVGFRAMISLTQRNHKPVPFGALVTLDAGQQGSIVGDEGLVYLSGLPVKGVLNVQWGQAKGQNCKVAYQLPKESEHTPIITLAARCENEI